MSKAVVIGGVFSLIE